MPDSPRGDRATPTPDPSSSRHSLGLQLPSGVELDRLSSELKNSLPSGSLNDADAAYLQDAGAFLIRLGRVLHAQGTSAMRVEEAIANCAARLGVQVQTFSTPTSLFVSVGDERNGRTHLVRVEPGEVNLSKLVELNHLIDAIAQGEMSLRSGFMELERVAAARPPYHAVLTPLAFGVSSAGAASFFRGSANDVLFSGAVGLLLGCVALLMGRERSARMIYPAFAAFLASAAPLIAQASLPHAGRFQGLLAVSDSVVTVAALIVLIPGLTLTVAMNELSTEHLMSGTARFAGAAVTFLEIVLGVALGREVVSRLMISHGAELLALREASTWPLPKMAAALALLLAPVAFGVLFRARRRDIPLVVAVSACGFGGARAGAHLLGPELGVFVGALVVGAVSNLIARRLKLPASVTLVPGIVLLVPGSIGFRSLNSFLERDIVTGTEGMFRMFLVAVALVGGLLVANTLLPPRRDL